MATIPYYTSQRLKLLKDAADQWVRNTGISWDIAAMWNLPNGDVPGGIDNVEIEVGKRLRRYFNLLDRRIYKARSKSGCRVQRFITIEHAHSVGWHVHGILATPPHMDRQVVINIAKKTWLDCLANSRVGLPKSKLAWCDTIQNRYPQYTTKQSFGSQHNARGTIDLMNTNFN